MPAGGFEPPTPRFLSSSVSAGADNLITHSYESRAITRLCYTGTIIGKVRGFLKVFIQEGEQCILGFYLNFLRMIALFQKN